MQQALFFLGCFLYPLLVLGGTGMFFAAVLMLFGSINIGMAPPKTWSYWIVLVCLVAASFACFFFTFGHRR